MRSRRPALLVLLAAGAAALAMGAQPSQAGQPGGVAHHADGRPAHSAYHVVPRLFDIHHHAGEPTIGITRGGWVVVTAGAGCVTSCLGSTQTIETVAPGGRAVLMTRDNGKTWQDISPGADGVSPHVTSLDPYLFLDHNGDTDRIFDIDLNLACNEISFTDDFGKTWITNPIACGEPVNDHQTVFSGKRVTSPVTVRYSKVVYYCFNKLEYTDCTKSLDGGLTWIPTANTSNPECSGLNGHGVTNSKGWMLIPYKGCNDTPSLAVSKDEGASWSVLHVAPGAKINGGDPSVAVDAKDNLYYLYDDAGRQPVLVVSKNNGRTWTKPIDVAAPGVKRTNLATLTVGAPGKVAIAYYGTTFDTDNHAFWNGYLASGVGVLGPNPTFYSAAVNDPRHPLKTGACGPGRCGRVLDFIDVEIAPNGQPWAAYVDACADVCERTGKESLADNEGMIGTLLGGPNLKR